MTYEYEYPRLGNTADVFILDPKQEGVFLIKRVNEPFGWALPGGFVNPGETTMQAAIREAGEETGCRLARVEQFHTYSAPDRDPREQAITTAYIAHTLDFPVAADDAKAVGFFDFATMRAYSIVNQEQGDLIPATTIVFDHMQMIIDLMHYLKTGQRPTRE